MRSLDRRSRMAQEAQQHGVRGFPALHVSCLAFTRPRKRLKSFYQKFNPEKLDEKGEIKDVEEVWKKWKGKEPSMFMALATKYKDCHRCRRDRHSRSLLFH